MWSYKRKDQRQGIEENNESSKLIIHCYKDEAKPSNPDSKDVKDG